MLHLALAVLDRRGRAVWLSATRAQAVSSKLTDLSGNWRSVM